jgi:hypothetical protein
MSNLSAFAETDADQDNDLDYDYGDAKNKGKTKKNKAIQWTMTAKGLFSDLCFHRLAIACWCLQIRQRRYGLRI